MSGLGLSLGVPFVTGTGKALPDKGNLIALYEGNTGEKIIDKLTIVTPTPDITNVNCLSSTGAQTISNASIADGAVVVNAGTAVGTATAGVITFTAGTISNIQLDGVLTYTCAEATGFPYDVTGSGNHITAMTTTWTTSDDILGRNPLDGFRGYRQTGAASYFYETASAAENLDSFEIGLWVAVEVTSASPVNVFANITASASDDFLSFGPVFAEAVDETVLIRTGSGTNGYYIRDNIPAGYHYIRGEWVGGRYEFSVDGVAKTTYELGTGFQLTSHQFYLGRRGATGAFYPNQYGYVLVNDVILLVNAHVLDSSVTDSGTEVLYVPALADGSAAADGEALTNLGGYVHNYSGVSNVQSPTATELLDKVVLTLNGVESDLLLTGEANGKSVYNTGDNTLTWTGSVWSLITQAGGSDHPTATGQYPPKTGWPNAEEGTVSFDYDMLGIEDDGALTELSIADYLAFLNGTKNTLLQWESIGGVCHLRSCAHYAQGVIEGWSPTQLAQGVAWAERYTNTCGAGTGALSGFSSGFSSGFGF